MLKKQLPVMYIADNTYFPFLISSKLSKLKVEKVVNPPKKPIVIKSFSSGGKNSVLFKVIPTMYPIRKQPAKFAIKVPYNDELQHDLATQDIKNLVTAPNPPPTNTAKIL